MTSADHVVIRPATPADAPAVVVFNASTTTPDETQPTVDNVSSFDPTDLATIATANPAVTYALGPRHPAADLLERTGRHERLHIRSQTRRFC